MLPREKRRAGWSIAVGVAVAGLVAGYSHFQVSDAYQRLHNSVQECERRKAILAATQLTNGQLSDDYAEACLPDTYISLHDHDLSVLERKVFYTEIEADNDRADGRFFSLIAFAIFCLPLVWYLALGRIRELSAAITGRDRNG